MDGQTNDDLDSDRSPTEKPGRTQVASDSAAGATDAIMPEAPAALNDGEPDRAESGHRELDRAGLDPAGPVPSALIRVSNAERDAIVARLNAATGEGRLTLEEFGERVERALAARTRGDLDVVVSDLPSTAVGGYARAVAESSGGTQTLGSIKRGGRWRLDRDATLATVFGSVKVDLRHAEVAAPEVHLRVEAVFGSVKVWVPRGIAVRVSGDSVFGSRAIEEDSPMPGAPLLQLHVDTVFGSVKVYRV